MITKPNFNNPIDISDLSDYMNYIIFIDNPDLLLHHKNASVDLQIMLAQDPCNYVKMCLASVPYLDIQAQNILAKDPEIAVKVSLGKNPVVDQDILGVLINLTHDEYILRIFGENENINYRNQHKLLYRKNLLINEILAMNPNTSEDILMYMLDMESSRYLAVIERILYRENLSPKIYEKILEIIENEITGYNEKTFNLIAENSGPDKDIQYKIIEIAKKLSPREFGNFILSLTNNIKLHKEIQLYILSDECVQLINKADRFNSCLVRSFFNLARNPCLCSEALDKLFDRSIIIQDTKGLQLQIIRHPNVKDDLIHITLELNPTFFYEFSHIPRYKKIMANINNNSSKTILIPYIGQIHSNQVEPEEEL
jgi:hypothetical protein